MNSLINPIKRHPLPAGIVLLLIILFMIWQTIVNKTKDHVDTRMSVETYLVKPQSISRKGVFAGRVVNMEEIPVYSTLAQGRVAEVLVEKGDSVVAGQTLAMLDKSLFQLQVVQQRAALSHAVAEMGAQSARREEARLGYAQAKANLARAQTVAGTGVLSQEAMEQRAGAEQSAKSQLQSAESLLKSAQAEVSMAEAQLAEAQLRLENTVIRSPVTGLILKKLARTGMVTEKEENPLFVVVRDHQYEVELDTSASDAFNLKKDLPVQILTLDSKRKYSGKVRVAPNSIDAQQVEKVRISFDAGNDRFLSGERAEITLDYPPRIGLYVPLAALRIEDNQAYVFTIRDGKATRVPVMTGQNYQGLIEITSGLQPGTVIIDKVATFLHDNEPVVSVSNQTIKSKR